MDTASRRHDRLAGQRVPTHLHGFSYHMCDIRRRRSVKTLPTQRTSFFRPLWLYKQGRAESTCSLTWQMESMAVSSRQVSAAHVLRRQKKLGILLLFLFLTHWRFYEAPGPAKHLQHITNQHKEGGREGGQTNEGRDTATNWGEFMFCFVYCCKQT